MKERILRLLSSNPGYLSGQRISSELGISRSAIWKHIRALREAGYAIESKPSSGYRLVDTRAHFGREAVIMAARDSGMGFDEILYFDSVGSTNQIAKQQKGSASALIVADGQTEGRGRLGRTWDSETSGGLYMSLRLCPDLPPSDAVYMTQLAALAVVEALETLYGQAFRIKWPNDIVYNGRKLAGILTEMTTELDRIESLVIGIGINVSQCRFSEELSDKAISLAQILPGEEERRPEMLTAILAAFKALYEEFLQKRSLEFVREPLNRYSSLLGREIVVISGDERIFCKAVEIDGSGRLVVEDGSGARKTLYYGEVSVRGRASYGE